MSFKNLKYRFFINFFENKKKLIWTLKNNLFNNVVCPPTISVVKLTQNTILGKKNERMFVVNDSFQSWNVINDANFQIEFIKKIKSLLTSSIKYDFVDIGANIGIMTKCLINNNIRLRNIYCVEPDQDNFFCLRNNLTKFKNIKFFKFALDKKKAKKNFILIIIIKEILVFFMK